MGAIPDLAPKNFYLWFSLFLHLPTEWRELPGPEGAAKGRSLGP